MRKLCRVDLDQSERIVEKFRPQTVILIGSFARKDINEGSDVDILVIADFKEPFLEGIGILLQLNEDLKLPLEPVGHTPEEFQKIRAEGNRFVEEVLQNGKVLLGHIPAPLAGPG